MEKKSESNVLSKKASFVFGCLFYALYVASAGTILHLIGIHRIPPESAIAIVVAAFLWGTPGTAFLRQAFEKSENQKNQEPAKEKL